MRWPHHGKFQAGSLCSHCPAGRTTAREHSGAGAGRKSGASFFEGGQTVDEHQTIHQAFDELDQAVNHVSDVLLALAEAVNRVPKL